MTQNFFFTLLSKRFIIFEENISVVWSKASDETECSQLTSKGIPTIFSSWLTTEDCPLQPVISDESHWKLPSTTSRLWYEFLNIVEYNWPSAIGATGHWRLPNTTGHLWRELLDTFVNDRSSTMGILPSMSHDQFFGPHREWVNVHCQLSKTAQRYWVRALYLTQNPLIYSARSEVCSTLETFPSYVWSNKSDTAEP